MTNIKVGHRIDGPNSLIEHCQKCADEVAAWPESKLKAASVISVTALNAAKSPYRHDLHQDGAMVGFVTAPIWLWWRGYRVKLEDLL